MSEYLFQLPIEKHKEIVGSAYSPTVALIELIKNASDACLDKNDTISVALDTDAQTITVADNGSGFSLEDFEKLSKPTDSKKMKGTNLLSAIEEPYAGSKGMGILTAFTLCEELHISTFSSDDGAGYKLIWKKENTEFSSDLAPDVEKGTTLVLSKIPKDIFDFLTDEEELAKIALASITYFEGSATLPFLELQVDGRTKCLLPNKKIDEVFKQQKYKLSKKRGFVAKVSFKYENDILTLSHTDDLTGRLNFTDEQINLSDKEAIFNFIGKFKIHAPKISDWFDELCKHKSSLDPFSGVFYVWRGIKTNELAQITYGIPIYANNYGLYNFLDRTNDWLQLSQVSQLVKNTDYKLHNTYGFVHFYSFNESCSHLKISNERQDFLGNTAYKKFRSILRYFVVGIFSQANIGLRATKKNSSAPSIFKEKGGTRTILLGEKITINDLITTESDLNSIVTSFPSGVTVDALGEIAFSTVGEFSLKFTHEGKDIIVKAVIRPNTPSFELNKNHKKTVVQGNTINLQDFISVSSLVNINLDDIVISCTSAKIAKNQFPAKNQVGDHAIVFKYDAPDGTSIQKTTILKVEPLFNTEANIIKKLFPYFDASNAPRKMTELIDGISAAYIQHPLICMIAIRCLVDAGLRDYQCDYLSSTDAYEDTGVSLHSRFNIVTGSAFAPSSTVPCEVQSKYRRRLTGQVRKNLHDYIRTEASLNFFVHNPGAVATSVEVLQCLKKLEYLLNFLIDAIRLRPI